MLKNQEKQMTPEFLCKMIDKEFALVLQRDSHLQNTLKEWGEIAEETDCDLKQLRPFILKDMICQLVGELNQTRFHLYAIGDN